jgi:hypothetical protein
MRKDNSAQATKKHDLVVTRLDAPLEDRLEGVGRSGNSKAVVGPEGFTCPVAKMDFREGRTSLVEDGLGAVSR